MNGAGSENRTRVISLEGCCLSHSAMPASWSMVMDLNHRCPAGRLIYSQVHYRSANHRYSWHTQGDSNPCSPVESRLSSPLDDGCIDPQQKTSA